MSKEIIMDAVKVSPPVTVAGLTWKGITLSEWVMMLTAVYTALMIFVTLRRLWMSRRLSRTDPVCAEDCPVARRLVEEAEKKAAK